jgi:hypothetical protein
VLQGFSFFPRGGSAHVVRYLTAALLQSGWNPRILAGSLGGPGELSHAATFFAGLPVSAADFTPALDAWRRDEDPLDQPVPLHASYEDKPDAPDRIFAAVSPELAVRQVDSWRRLLLELAPVEPQVLHLHHLTPLHDAAEEVFPEVPVVTHLHGTELLMLEQIEQFSSAKGIEWPYPPITLPARCASWGARGSCDHHSQRGGHRALSTSRFLRARATGAAAALARRRPARMGREWPRR